MGNPAIATLPMVIITPNSNGYQVEVYHLPSGIWRKSGETECFATMAETIARATSIQAWSRGTIGLTFAAATKNSQGPGK